MRKGWRLGFSHTNPQRIFPSHASPMCLGAKAQRLCCAARLKTADASEPQLPDEILLSAHLFGRASGVHGAFQMLIINAVPWSAEKFASPASQAIVGNSPHYKAVGLAVYRGWKQC